MPLSFTGMNSLNSKRARKIKLILDYALEKRKIPIA